MTTNRNAFTFNSESVDYAALAAAQRFPVALTADGIDGNAAARAAYAEGLDAGIRAATH